MYQERFFGVSKYTYNINEVNSNLFIFELVLKKFNNKNFKIRRIKNNKIDKLLCSDDKIIYSDIKRIIINAIDINNPNNIICFTCNLNQSTKHTLILNNNVFFEFFEKNGYLESNYNIDKNT